MKHHVPLTRGHLEVNNPYRLLASASVRGVTGALTLSRHRCVKQIYLKDGNIVGASSNQPSESLGTLLLCNGVISTDAYTQSLTLMDRSDKRHGEILVSLGALPAEKLPEMLRLQHLSRLTDAVTWTRGLYEFRAGEPPKTNEAFPLWLIFQAGLFRQLGKEKIVRSAQAHKGAVVFYRSSVLDPIVVRNPELFTIIGDINNERTIAQLAAAHQNQMLFFANLLLLRELGIVEFRKAAAAQKKAA